MDEIATYGVNIRISPFDALEVLAVDIKVSPNEHASASIRFVIEEEKEGEYLSLARSDLPVSIAQTDGAEDACVLFTGLIADMEVTKTNRLKVMELKLVSATRQMDVTERTRTYQDAALTYRNVLSSLGYYEDYAFSMREGDGVAIGDLVVQFKETDWAFVKRLASHFNTCVIPDYLSGNVGYFFGIPEKSSAKAIDPIYYRVMKGVGEYVSKSLNHVSGLIEGDSLHYIVRDRAVYRMGEEVRFKNRDLRVFSIHSVLEGQLLENYYTLKSDAGFKTKKAHNFRMVGASLGCKVVGVQKDTVQVHVYEDNDDYGTGAKWFAYSTVYSSPDGTGWYAMPEIGDELRLYFPSEHEAQAYTISAVNVDTPGMGGGAASPEAGILPLAAPRTHPETKTVINKELKEVSLYPDKIVMTNNKDMMVVVDDAEGVIIQSAKKVTFKSDEAISMVTSQADFNLVGADGVTITVGGTKVVLNKNVAFEGGTLQMQ